MRRVGATVAHRNSLSPAVAHPKRVTSALGLLDLDGLLDWQELEVASSVQRFVVDRVKPHLPKWFEEGTFPARELAPELGKLGLLGMHLQGYGCAGASAVSYGLACLELEAGDSGLRSFVSVQGSL